MKQKKWKSPKLICITRGKPHERVLDKCEYVPMYGIDTGVCVRNDNSTADALATPT